jgi:hypothetical protein
MKRNYKYKVGQKLINEQVGEIKVMHRWKGKDLNFYDVMGKGMWYITFDETQMISGYDLRKNRGT